MRPPRHYITPDENRALLLSRPKRFLSLDLPTSWEQMTGQELLYIYRLIALGYDFAKVETFAATNLVPPALRSKIDPRQLAWVSYRLRFIEQPPAAPVRPPKLWGAKALDAELKIDVPFSSYLIIQNLWQAYIQSLPADHTPAKDELLTPPALALLRVLYPGYKEKRKEPAHALVAVYWLQGLQSLLSRTFPDLFQPRGEKMGETDLREQMETQIRALTGGDITKREIVLRADTWAALSELNAKAREAAQTERLMRK